MYKVQCNNKGKKKKKKKKNTFNLEELSVKNSIS